LGEGQGRPPAWNVPEVKRRDHAFSMARLATATGTHVGMASRRRARDVEKR
jgi:hypothetical protein